MLTFAPHPNSVSTLPCETLHSRFASEEQLELRTEKNTKMFLSYLLQNEGSFDKVSYVFPDKICHNVMSKSKDCIFFNK